MSRGKLFLLGLIITTLNVRGQEDPETLKANAIRINDPNILSDSIYNLLSPFQVVMFGEMHGTNESAAFINGLTNLLTIKGDSVQVGLEISPTLMKEFIMLHTNLSIYQSEFFFNPPYLDGRESFAWAKLISKLNQNPKVQIFFFDVIPGEGKPYQRDSFMFEKIKNQFKQHPTWKMVTLSGNFHNRISGEQTMALFLKKDKELNLSQKICSLNMEYNEGTCMANFGNGLESKQLGSYPTIYNTTLSFNKYIYLVSSKAKYDYNGFYYTKFITAAKMTSFK